MKKQVLLFVARQYIRKAKLYRPFCKDAYKETHPKMYAFGDSGFRKNMLIACGLMKTALNFM